MDNTGRALCLIRGPRIACAACHRTVARLLPLLLADPIAIAPNIAALHSIPQTSTCICLFFQTMSIGDL